MSAWRQVGGKMWARRGARAALFVIAAMWLVAAMADLLASDKPLVARLNGVLYVLPAYSDPAPLRTHNITTLRATLVQGDWFIRPLVPWGPDEQAKGEQPLAAPSLRHWLGTDTVRRDVLSRMIHGARVSIAVGVVSVSIYITLGTLLGLLAATRRGWTDMIISRLAEVMITIPVFFLILAVMGVIEQAGVGTMMIVIGLVYWTHVTRLVRGEALRVVQLPFVEAAVGLGYSNSRIMFRHVLPNVLGPVLVFATFGVAAAILVEASLSFLGFGTPDHIASWGGLLRGAMGNFQAWWLVAFPGLAVFVSVTAYNLVGEALRDALDPRLPMPGRGV